MYYYADASEGHTISRLQSKYGNFDVIPIYKPTLESEEIMDSVKTTSGSLMMKVYYSKPRKEYFRIKAYAIDESSLSFNAAFMLASKDAFDYIDSEELSKRIKENE